jgi:tetratricopeptide (TPR) repeat protein
MFARWPIILVGLAASVVAAARVPATTPAGPSSEVMTLLEQGSKQYLERHFAAAIPLYAKALELEKKRATLDKALWRVLVDNLGMAYGITGDLSKAKTTFEYGLSKDDSYPMFYYNLACTYAELGDLDGTLANLRLAFKYRDNMMRGEEFPDPAYDDSFKRYLKNERFIALLREFKAAR